MTLNPVALTKVDPLLQAALQEARPGEILRAVYLLRDPDGSGDVPSEEPAPEDFSTREEYRRALIEWKRHRLKSGPIGATIRALEELSLHPRGGDLGHTVVVEGPAENILRSLELPGVSHASLDRPINLVQPRRPS